MPVAGPRERGDRRRRSCPRRPKGSGSGGANQIQRTLAETVRGLKNFSVSPSVQAARKIPDDPVFFEPIEPLRGCKVPGARRQSRTGHGRTGHEENPPVPPAYPPPSSQDIDFICGSGGSSNLKTRPQFSRQPRKALHNRTKGFCQAIIYVFFYQRPVRNSIRLRPPCRPPLQP